MTRPLSSWLSSPAARRSFTPLLTRLEDRCNPTNTLSVGDATLIEGDSGTADLVFTVTRSGDLSAQLSVGYATADGTAAAGRDYAATSGTLTIPAGSPSAEVRVPVTGDLLDEPDRAFTLTLSGPVLAAGGPFTFAPRQAVATRVAPVGISTADFNADGLPDLAVAARDSDRVSVFLNTTPAGSATATFAARLDILTGSEAHAVAVGDFNGDGVPDLAVANRNSETVTVLLNTTATGATAASFATGVSYSTQRPRSVAVADVNADGKPDLVLASEDFSRVAVFLNTAAAGATAPAFAPVQIFSTTGGPVRVLLADVNGDGRPDVVTAGGGSGGTVAVLLNGTSAGSSTVTLEAVQSFAVASGPADMAVGDLNGDGRPDFVASSFDTNQISVLLNTTPAGGTTVSTATRQDFAVGVAPRGVTLADLDGDGVLDVVVANSNTVIGASASNDTISVFRNRTAAGASAVDFGSRQDFAAGHGEIDSVVADLNGDGVPDLAVADRFDDTFSTFLQTSFRIADGVAVGVVTDNDPPPSVAIGDVTRTEGDTGTTTLTFTVTLSGPSGKAVGVAYTTADGTALAGSDYAAAAGTLTFAPGETTKTVTVLATGDTTVEPDQTFEVNLSAPTNATLADPQGVGTITNDDAPPAPAITGPTASTEGVVVTLDGTFTAPAGASNAPYTYAWSVSASNGQTVPGASGTVSVFGSVPPFPFTPADDGTYTVSLVVADKDGAAGPPVTRTLAVGNLDPTVTALNVPPAAVGGKPVTVSAAATDPAGLRDVLIFNWTVTRDGGGAAFSGTGPTFTFTPPAGGMYTVTLTATDGDGGSATATRTVSVSPPPRVVSAVGPTVRVFDPLTGGSLQLTPFPGFAGEVRVAVADLTGDGRLDVIVAAGAGGGPAVKVYDGLNLTEAASFFAFDPGFTGGVYVAAGGGKIVVGAGAGGGPHVKSFTPAGTETASFYAYDPGFGGGVRVAVGDVDADGVADIVTGAGPGAAPHVKVFGGVNGSEVASFYAFAPSFGGGVFVASTAGRIAVGADAGAAPHVKTFDRTGGEGASFYAFDPAFAGGVRVGFADADGDGTPDLIAGAGPGGGPNVRAFSVSPLGLLTDRMAGDPLDPRGVFVG